MCTNSRQALKKAEAFSRIEPMLLAWIIHEGKKGLSLARIETSMQATQPCQTSPLTSSSPSVSMRNCPLALVCLSVSTSR